jgi:hypothetical protein
LASVGMGHSCLRHAAGVRGGRPIDPIGRPLRRSLGHPRSEVGPCAQERCPPEGGAAPVCLGVLAVVPGSCPCGRGVGPVRRIKPRPS